MAARPASPKPEPDAALRAKARAASRAAATKELLNASAQGRLKTVRKLLRDGVDPNVTNENGATPFLLASARRRFDVMKTLLANGADLRRKNKFGITPILYAAETGHTDVVDFILARTSPPSARPDKGLHVLKGEFDPDETLALQQRNSNGGSPGEGYITSVAAKFFKDGRIYEYAENGAGAFDVYKHVPESTETKSYASDEKLMQFSAETVKVLKIGEISKSYMHDMVDRKIEELCRGGRYGTAQKLAGLTADFRSDPSASKKPIVSDNRRQVKTYFNVSGNHEVSTGSSGLSPFQLQSMGREMVARQNEATYQQILASHDRS